MKSLAILTIGTEILEGQMIDRNSAFISEKLFSERIPVKFHLSVADDRVEILNLLNWLMPQIDGLITTGGLGPTRDDFTRNILAEYANQNLIFDESNFTKIEKLLLARGVPVTAMQRQQSYFPEGAEVFKNERGTADGFGFIDNQKAFLILPGPPLEVQSILETGLPWLLSQIEHRTDEIRHTFSFLGLGESQVAELFERIFNAEIFKIGYRVHIPFVEVKVWYQPQQRLNFNTARDVLLSSMTSYLVFENNDDYIHQLAKNCEKLDFIVNCSVLIRDGSDSGAFSSRLEPIMSKVVGIEKVEMHIQRKKYWERLPTKGNYLEFSLSMNSDGLEVIVNCPNGKSKTERFVAEFGSPRYREHWMIERVIQWMIPAIGSFS